MYRGAASLFILAHLPGRTLRSIYANDAESIADAALGTSAETFKNTLREIRNHGVWVTRGQLDKGMIGISAPIFLSERQIAGSVSIVLSEEETEEHQIAGAAALVQAAAKEIDVGLKEFEAVSLNETKGLRSTLV